ncbi:MAG: hypothetical protein J0H42_10770 [Rhizobiales bacterium]|nr:hypothetical protein [Hyphomicrobiales bacterium]
MCKFLPLIALVLLAPTTAHSENLNLKFGPTWSCTMISAELKERYEACRVCERQKKDFDPDLPGDKCVEKASPYSLREKMQQRYMGAPSPEADAVNDIADRQWRQKQIEREAKEKEAAIQERNRSESNVSGGASRAPANRNSEELAKLNDEMEKSEARLKEDAERRKSGQGAPKSLFNFDEQKDLQRRKREEMTKLNDEMEKSEARLKEDAERRKSGQGAPKSLFNFDEPTPSPDRSSDRDLPSSKPQDEFAPDVVIFALQNGWNYTIHANFRSKSRNVVWPGSNKAYILDDHKLHKIRLSCRPGEKICFGAWAAGNSEPIWGTGQDGTAGCQNCCSVCGSTSIVANNLIYVPERGGGGGRASSSAISAADLLGAAIGIAGVVAGSGGGGSSYRAAPNYSPGPPPRNRESGVSGGR